MEARVRHWWGFLITLTYLQLLSTLSGNRRFEEALLPVLLGAQWAWSFSFLQNHSGPGHLAGSEGSHVRERERVH